MTNLNDAKDADVRLIAFYLPQFHPIPENDEWWGKGFTEWTNVTKAKPLFHGHYQPHLPADLGFYDLRLRETRREQIALAKSSGIDGFCYHYYWFSGKRLLEQPIEDMLADPESDMPFCLCWANENWTRRWDAKEKELLIAQRHEPQDNLEFIKSLEPYLTDPRYIKVDGAPLIVVYYPQNLDEPKKAMRVWREYCASIGIPQIHIACALTHGNWSYKAYGFDSGVEFPPHNIKVPNLGSELSFYEKFNGFCVDYADVAEFHLDLDHDTEFSSVFRTVYPSWDNTARRKSRALFNLNGTPENYQTWLGRTIEKTKADYPNEDRLVFINAWNEWAEGCHLEPDQKHGHGFLEATLAAKNGTFNPEWTHRGIPAECENAPKSIEYARTKAKSTKKNALKRGFRAVRDTLNGRRFRKDAVKIEKPLTKAEKLNLKPAVFLHIQKTAGTSLVHMARQQYGNTDVSSHGDYMSAPMDRRRFVSGHFGYHYAMSLPGDRYSFTFLRDPIERVISLYNFSRNRDPEQYPMYKLAHENSFHDFLKITGETPDREGEPMLIGNYEHVWNNMTWQLAYGWDAHIGRNGKSVLDFEPTELIELAKQNLLKLDYFGLQETFNEDARHVAAALGMRTESIPRQNTSSKTVTLDSLDAPTAQLLSSLTELDRELYEFARSYRMGGAVQTPVEKEPAAIEA